MNLSEPFRLRESARRVFCILFLGEQHEFDSLYHVCARVREGPEAVVIPAPELFTCRRVRDGHGVTIAETLPMLYLVAKMPHAHTLREGALGGVADAGVNELGCLVGPCWSAARAEHALGRPVLEGLRRDRQVLALETGGGVEVYPLAQFERRGNATRVKLALQGWFAILGRLDGWTVAVLLFAPAAELGYLSPLAFAREARGDPVARRRLLDYGRTLAAELGSTL